MMINMNLQQLIGWDKKLLLALNGSDSSYFDNFMMTHTGMWVWIPFFIILVYVIIRSNRWKEALLVIAMVGIVVLLADRISSGFFKPFFQRFRPTHDPSIMELVNVVDNYRVGKYGFVSSHAANSIGIATFLSLVFRRKWISFALFLWAVMHSYTRIYLGVHFPGDILCGSIVGAVVGWSVYMFLGLISRRYMCNSCNYTVKKYKSADEAWVISVLGVTYFFLFIWAFF